MAKPKFWNFKAKGDDTGELMLYGDISSSSWLGDEITPKDFKADLDSLGTIKNLNIYINSGGGDVFAGQAIFSMLKRHESRKTVYIDGIAASIASVIAMAGDKIIMPKNAMMMIHNGWSIMAGDAKQFRKMAEDLEKVDESIQSVYVGRTGIDQTEIAALMDKETWFTADDAVKRGFADEIEQEKKLAASMHGGFLMLGNQTFDMSRYQNIPDIEPVVLIEATEDIEQPNDSKDESRLVADKQNSLFTNIRKKILKAYEKEI